MMRLIRILFGTFLFIFPFSLRFLVYEENAYRFGNFNPWVSEFIYAPETLLVLTFVLWIAYPFFRDKPANPWLRIKHNFKKTVSLLTSKTVLPLFILMGLFIANGFIITFWKGDGISGLFWLLRLIEGLMLYKLITAKILEPSKIVHFLLLGAAFQVALSLLQWQLNHSLGLTFLGESFLGPDVPNVAKLNLTNGLKQIRVYGTFLHPNILAAYLLTILLIAPAYLKPKAWFAWFLFIGFGIYLTHSRAALVVGVIALSGWAILNVIKSAVWRRYLIMGCFVFLIAANGWLFFKNYPSSYEFSSFLERQEQNQIARRMALTEPLGIGIRDFTLEMEGYAFDCNPEGAQTFARLQGCSPQKLKPWEFQPVHNTYFLILNETGIQGLLLLIAVIFIILYRYAASLTIIPFFALLLLAPFDHFLWDGWVGLIIFFLTFGFIKSDVIQSKS